MAGCLTGSESVLAFDEPFPKFLKMTGFFEELKRRKVYRVAAGYIVVAGGTIQLASVVFPAWDLPEWSLRLVIVASPAWISGVVTPGVGF